MSTHGTQPLSVTMANGSRMLSKSTCHGFCWEMQGEEFEADLRLLQLGGKLGCGTRG